MEFSPVFMRILTRKFAIKLLINMLFTNFEEYIYTEFTTTISHYNLRFSYSCTIFELASTNRLSLGNSILSDVNEFHCFWLKRCLISCTFIFLQLINQFQMMSDEIIMIIIFKVSFCRMYHARKSNQVLYHKKMKNKS